MAKGYPSRRRARKAFERGVKDGRQRLTHIHPYANPRLAGIYAKSLEVGLGMEPLPRRRSVRARARAVHGKR